MLKILVMVQWLLAPLPAALMLGLYALSNRGAQLIGKLPEASRNDPGQIGLQDSTYQMLYGWVNELLTGFIYSFLVWFPLSIATAALCVHYRKQQKLRRWVWAGWVAIAVYVIGVLILWWEPTNRLGWFFD